MSDSLFSERMAAELRKFADCEHKNWKCCECGCKTARRTVGEIERTQYIQEVIAVLQDCVFRRSEHSKGWMDCVEFICDSLGIGLVEPNDGR